MTKYTIAIWAFCDIITVDINRKEVFTVVVRKYIEIDIDDMIFDGCDVIISDR